MPRSAFETLRGKTSIWVSVISGGVFLYEMLLVLDNGRKKLYNYYSSREEGSGLIKPDACRRAAHRKGGTL